MKHGDDKLKKVAKAAKSVGRGATNAMALKSALSNGAKKGKQQNPYNKQTPSTKLQEEMLKYTKEKQELNRRLGVNAPSTRSIEKSSAIAKKMRDGYSKLKKKAEKYKTAPKAGKAKEKGYFDVEVDGEKYGIKGKKKTKTTKSGKTVEKFKGKGVGYSDVIKKTKGKKVKRNGVVIVDMPAKTKYRTPEQVEKRVERSYKKPFKK
jgi:hypothetical protein